MNSRTLLLFSFAFGVIATAALAAPKDDLLAADRAYSQLSVEKGSNAANLAYIADDVRMFGDGSQPPIHGKAEAIKRFKTSSNGDPKNNVLSWVPDHATVSADGTLGYTDGHWLFKGGDSFRATGHYITVWRKDAGGAWKIIANMGSTDPKPRK